MHGKGFTIKVLGQIIADFLKLRHFRYVDKYPKELSSDGVTLLLVMGPNLKADPYLLLAKLNQLMRLEMLLD